VTAVSATTAKAIIAKIRSGNPLRDFLKHGIHNGFSPNRFFDPQWYRDISGGCVIETALKGAVHHPVGKINVYVKRAVIAGFCSRLLAFEFSKGANFKPVISNCLDPLDGAGTAGFLDERYRLSRLLHQIVLKCVAHLIFSWSIAMRVKNYADSDRYYN
jgi:hypothetical protein